MCIRDSLSLVFLLTSTISFSQNQEQKSDSAFKRNVIGIQFNPLSDGNGKYSVNLLSARYGYKIFKPLTIGAEVNGYFYKSNFIALVPLFNGEVEPNHYYLLSTNLYLRYTLRPDKRIQGFLEVSPFAYFAFKKPMNYIDMETGWYIAPGISVFSKNRKFSMDLYYKFPNDPNFNNKRGDFCYKLNFHF